MRIEQTSSQTRLSGCRVGVPHAVATTQTLVCELEGCVVAVVVVVPCSPDVYCDAVRDLHPASALGLVQQSLGGLLNSVLQCGALGGFALRGLRFRHCLVVRCLRSAFGLRVWHRRERRGLQSDHFAGELPLSNSHGTAMKSVDLRK